MAKINTVNVECPHCGEPFPVKPAALMLRLIPDARRAAISRKNGKRGGRPKLKK